MPLRTSAPSRVEVQTGDTALNVIIENPDEPSQSLVTDSIVGALATIDIIHHETHEGKTFLATFFSASYNSGTTMQILLRTAAKYAHLTVYAASGGDARLTFGEAPTVTLVGSVLGMFNMNRPNVIAPTVLAYHTPTTAGGLALLDELMPGGRGGSSTGATVRPQSEWILKANTDYVLTLTNLSTTAEPGSITCQWYEAETA